LHSGEVQSVENPGFDDSKWRVLDVPHGWSIELPYEPKMPGGSAVAYLPGGIGWYRQSFTLPKSEIGNTIDFDGDYMNSQAWINGHLLGRIPNGSIGFRLFQSGTGATGMNSAPGLSPKASSHTSEQRRE
jgi:beta-galactosidase